MATRTGDTHRDNFEGTPRQDPVLDQVMLAQLADLQAKGLLDQRLVVLGTEYGRRTRPNDDGGRDHHGLSRLLGPTPDEILTP